MELFNASSELSHQPLAYRMRPRILDEFIGQEHIIGKGKLLRRAIQTDQLSSIILFGPPGTGKTTLARVIANSTSSHFSTLNAVLSGVKELRYEIEQAKERLSLYHKKTILFVDEVHRWNKSQQDALLPWVENGTLILIGATTQNPYFEVNSALVSRSRIFQLKALSEEDLFKIANQALLDHKRGYGNWEIKFEKGALEHLVHTCNGDARSLLNALQLAIESTYTQWPPPKDTLITISLEAAEESIQKRAVLYDKGQDNHYDTISAFIKSIRGSDVDASLYYLAKMVYSGEDPSFIFRRLVISASEDVGLADPNALSVVTSAAAAFERVGLPEGQYHLAHATIYLATAPKSNSTKAFFEILNVVEQEISEDIPNHLKDASRDSKSLGHGVGYLYPHDYEDNWVAQQYLPNNLQTRSFYKPSNNGYEKQIREFLNKRKSQFNLAKNSKVLLLNSQDDKSLLDKLNAQYTLLAQATKFVEPYKTIKGEPEDVLSNFSKGTSFDAIIANQLIDRNNLISLLEKVFNLTKKCYFLEKGDVKIDLKGYDIINLGSFNDDLNLYQIEVAIDKRG
jgi:putative ATPase